MLYLNNVTVAGNLFEDPKVFDKSVILKIAVNKPARENETTGQPEQSKPTRIEVKIFNQNARNYAANYMKKGDHIYVEGRLTDNTYTDGTGQTQYSQDFIGNRVSHCGPKGE